MGTPEQPAIWVVELGEDQEVSKAVLVDAVDAALRAQHVQLKLITVMTHVPFPLGATFPQSQVTIDAASPRKDELTAILKRFKAYPDLERVLADVHVECNDNRGLGVIQAAIRFGASMIFIGVRKSFFVRTAAADVYIEKHLPEGCGFIAVQGKMRVRILLPPPGSKRPVPMPIFPPAGGSPGCLLTAGTQASLTLSNVSGASSGGDSSGHFSRDRSGNSSVGGGSSLSAYPQSESVAPAPGGGSLKETSRSFLVESALPSGLDPFLWQQVAALAASGQLIVRPGPNAAVGLAAQGTAPGIQTQPGQALAGQAGAGQAGAGQSGGGGRPPQQQQNQQNQQDQQNQMQEMQQQIDALKTQVVPTADQAEAIPVTAAQVNDLWRKLQEAQERADRLEEDNNKLQKNALLMMGVVREAQSKSIRPWRRY